MRLFLCVKVVPAEYKFACAEYKNVGRQHNMHLVPDPYYNGPNIISHRTGYGPRFLPDHN